MSTANVLPTRMQLQNLKSRLLAADKGHRLLKKKADALNTRFRTMQNVIGREQMAVAELMKQARGKMVAARYAAGDISGIVMQGVGEEPAARVRCRIENVAGVLLPNFELVGEVRQMLTGLGRGGEEVKTAKNAYSSALERIVRLAALQASHRALSDVLKITSRRVNALENIVIPRLQMQIAYIESFLEEVDREEFFRLKMVSGKKDAAEEEEEAAAMAALEEPGTTSDFGLSAKQEAEEAALLAGIEDEDIIF